MIQKIVIKNFRGFSWLELDHLKRINVIVGRNGSGKTSLLEAIYLSSAAAVPNQVFQLRGIRKLGNQIQIAADPRSYESLWSDLFHWFQIDQTLSIEATGSSQDSRKLEISFPPNSSPTLPMGEHPASFAVMPQVEFRWKLNDQPEVVVRPFIAPNGLNMQGATVDHLPVIFFSSQGSDVPEEHAKRFSQLSVNGEIEPIIESMKSEFAMLESLSVEYFSNTPAVYASLVGGKRKIPLALLSDGINKLMGILLGIASTKDGIALIDQIEDGFYYDRFSSIWKLIRASAVQNNVQLFVTTHSKECLDALPDAIERHESEFSLIKAQGQTGKFDYIQVNGSSIKNAIRQGFDPR